MMIAKATLMLSAAAACLFAASCSPFLDAHPKIVPEVADLGECIVSHALKGESVAQVAISCATDAESVIADLLVNTDARVVYTHAHYEASMVQVRLTNMSNK